MKSLHVVAGASERHDWGRSTIITAWVNVNGPGQCTDANIVSINGQASQRFTADYTVNIDVKIFHSKNQRLTKKSLSARPGSYLIVDGIPFVMDGRIAIHANSFEFVTGYGGYKSQRGTGKGALKDKEGQRDIRNSFPSKEAEWASKVFASENLKSIPEEAQADKQVANTIDISSSAEENETANQKKIAKQQNSQKQKGRRKQSKEAKRQQPARNTKRRRQQLEDNEDTVEGEGSGSENNHIKLGNVHDYCEQMMKE